MGTLKSEMEKAVGTVAKGAKKKRKKASPHEPTVLECYTTFCQHLKDLCVTDPQGREIIFKIENFPYLIKAETFDKKQQKWVEATALILNDELESGTFDETMHRCDPARSRGLLRIPGIIKSPKSIHENIHQNIPGDFVYVVRVGADIYKLAFIVKNWHGEWVLVTSFYASGNYLKTCAKDPPEFPPNKKAT